MVGDFYQRALRSRIVDGRARFAEHEETSLFASLGTQLRGWFNQLFTRDKASETPAPRPAPRRPALPAPEAEVAPPAGTASSAAADVGPDDSSLALDRGETVIAVPQGSAADTAAASAADVPAGSAPSVSPGTPAPSVPTAPTFPATPPSPQAPAAPAVPPTPSNTPPNGYAPG
ncbi:hypothetical protein D9M72_416420 [compost metagenome]